ncbi:MAG TPA: GntR family transcriptional regulator [Pseudonocardiaceae bacterium]|nr:GntR family transcriptional regulator [Pseudonocardiaceae bacterium]
MTTSAPEVASQRIAAYLRAEILSGRIGPGERIRQEDVAARLGASRLPVREALRILEAEGLTEHSANRGARVPALTMRQVDMLYQIRERVEPLALVDGLPRVDATLLDRLVDLEKRIEAGTEVGEFVALDREFHLLTYSTCDQELLTSMIVRLWNSTQHYRRAYLAITGLSHRWVAHAEHNLLIEAMRRGDPADAERYLAGHIRRTRTELSRHPEAFAA